VSQTEGGGRLNQATLLTDVTALDPLARCQILRQKKGPLEMGEMERLGNLIYNGIQIWLQHDIGMSSAVA